MAGPRIFAIQIVLFALTLQMPGQVAAPAKRTLRDRTAASKKVPYSQFEHSAKAHRLSCSTCHKFPSSNWKRVRDEKSAFPDITEYPKHDSCVKCHTQQFFRGSRPQICTICHTAVSPSSPPRHPFPNPRELFDLSKKGVSARSDFAVRFPHESHMALLGQLRAPMVPFTRVSHSVRGTVDANDSCTMCHQTIEPQGTSDDEFVVKPPADIGDKYWLKKGTFKSAPIGHTTCFTCHSVESGMLPAPSDCAVCHQLRSSQPVLDFDPQLASRIGISDRVRREAWEMRQSAGTFRHEWFSHAELSCTACHDIAKMNTADPASTRVSVTACATCHVTPTSDDGGALNYEIDMRTKNAKFQCVKCHLASGRLPIPISHSDAIRAAAAK